MNNLTVLILAAGEGTKMTSLKTDTFKVMLPILGKPVLEYLLQNIANSGIKKVTIVVLEKTANQITAYFKNKWQGLEIDYIQIKQALGPSYALNEVKSHIKTPYFLVQYADSLANENLTKKLIEIFKKNPTTDGILAVREVDDPARYGIVEYKKGRIAQVVEKPTNPPSNHAVMGTFILKTDLFKKSIAGEKFIHKNQLFPAQYMLKKGAKIIGYFFDGKRVDVGKPEDLFNASMLLSDTPTKCVAFDADNTLYNTAQISNIADVEALKILSKEVKTDTEELFREWQAIVEIVKNSKTPQKRIRKYSYGMILEKYKKPDLLKKMYEVFRKTVTQNLKPIGEIQKILPRLPQKKILVTEDERELAVAKLKAVKLLEFFDQIISSTETETMKPAEIFYEQIFKKYKPQEVLFVGDDYKKDLEIPSKIGSKILFLENENSLDKLKTLFQKEIKNVHIMGAAGAGASAVAGIAQAYGYKVSACDLKPDSTYTKNLNIKIMEGHASSHLKNVDLLVTSPAIEKLDPKNSEIMKAKKKDIPVISWQEFQGKYLQKDKFVITVAGAYGKSTTTSMIAQILIDAGLDPTCEIGARVLKWQNNFRVGKSKYYVCESDEYNNNFLNYHPNIAVILNVEWDHPDFFKSQESVLTSYAKFIDNIKSNGSLIIGFDPKLQQLLKSKILTDTGSDPKIVQINDFGKLNLSVIGDFRQENANAALTVAQVLGINIKLAKKTLSKFKGVARRLEYKGEINGVKFYDDYAVQPYTVLKTINALKEKFPKSKLTLVFEPHTFSRIETFFKDFKKALKNSGADQILITEVYPAREQGNRETLSRKLVKKVGSKAKYTGSVQGTARYVKSHLKSFEIILSMGAGDSYKLFDLLKK